MLQVCVFILKIVHENYKRYKKVSWENKAHKTDMGNENKFSEKLKKLMKNLLIKLKRTSQSIKKNEECDGNF